MYVYVAEWDQNNNNKKKIQLKKKENTQTRHIFYYALRFIDWFDRNVSCIICAYKRKMLSFVRGLKMFRMRVCVQATRSYAKPPQQNVVLAYHVHVIHNAHTHKHTRGSYIKYTTHLFIFIRVYTHIDAYITCMYNIHNIKYKLYIRSIICSWSGWIIRTHTHAAKYRCTYNTKRVRKRERE